MLPNLGGLSLRAPIGAPKAAAVDPEEPPEPAQEQVFRELPELIVAQLLNGMGGDGVCAAVVDFCASHKVPCTGEAVWMAALAAFGITTQPIKDDVTAILVDWGLRAPLRPALGAQQLFMLLCNQLRKRGWAKPYGGWGNFPEMSEWMTSITAWNYRMLTLVSKPGITQMELDCLAGHFVGIQTASLHEQTERIGELVTRDRGDFRRIPWSDPSPENDGGFWKRITDETVLEAVKKMTAAKFAYIRAGRRLAPPPREAGDPFPTYEQAEAFWEGYAGVWTDVARELLNIDTTLSAFERDNGYMLDRIERFVRTRNTFQSGGNTETTEAIWGPGFDGSIHEYDDWRPYRESSVTPLYHRRDRHDLTMPIQGPVQAGKDGQQYIPSEDSFRVWCLGMPTRPAYASSSPRFSPTSPQWAPNPGTPMHYGAATP